MFGRCDLYSRVTHSPVNTVVTCINKQLLILTLCLSETYTWLGKFFSFFYSVRRWHRWCSSAGPKEFDLRRRPFVPQAASWEVAHDLRRERKRTASRVNNLSFTTSSFTTTNIFQGEIWPERLVFVLVRLTVNAGDSGRLHGYSWGHSGG